MTRSYTFFLCLAAFVMPIGITKAPAQTPTTANADNPAYVASRQAFEALPESERKAVQDALIWMGAYNATAGGAFGRQTYSGIVSYQKKENITADGIVSGELAERLKAAAEAEKATAGFKVIRDGKTGMDIGVPLKLLPKQSVNPTGGSRWQTTDGKITLDTRNVSGGTEEFQALYERSITASANRKVTYKLQKPDFFVVVGETSGGEFYIRYALGPEGLRGFTLGYDKSVKAGFNRIMIAIANSFVPFPSGDTGDAAREDGPKAVRTMRFGKDGTPLAQGRNPATAAPPEAVTALPMASDSPKKVPQSASRMPSRTTMDPAKFASGVRVGPRRVVTVGLACKNPVVAGSAAKVVKQAGDLVLLETNTDKSPETLPVRTGPVPHGAGLIVVSWDASAKAVGVVNGAGEDGESLNAALQIGGRGGLVFDRNGAIVGIVGKAQVPLRSISGVMTPASYAVIKSKDVQDFTGNMGAFSEEPMETAARQSTGAIAAKASPLIVDIACP